MNNSTLRSFVVKAYPLIENVDPRTRQIASLIFVASIFVFLIVRRLSPRQLCKKFKRALPPAIQARVDAALESDSESNDTELISLRASTTELHSGLISSRFTRGQRPAMTNLQPTSATRRSTRNTERPDYCDSEDPDLIPSREGIDFRIYHCNGRRSTDTNKYYTLEYLQRICRSWGLPDDGDKAAVAARLWSVRNNVPNFGGRL